MRLVVALSVLVLGASFVASRSAAQSAPQSASQSAQGERVLTAQRAEAECRLADARAALLAAIELGPGTRLAARAAQRLDAISRDSTDDAARVALCEHQRDAQRLGRADWVAYGRTLDRDPPGELRRRGRGLVAESLERLGDAAPAREAWMALAREPGAGSAEKHLANEGLARVERMNGNLAAGLQILRGAGLAGSPLAQALERESQRRIGRAAAAIVLGLFVLAVLILGGPRLASALLRALAPPRLLLAAWVLGVPLVIASLYDREALDTFASFALGGGFVLLLSALGGVSLPRGSAVRGLLAVGSVLATLAVGYLVLDRAGALIDLGL